MRYRLNNLKFGNHLRRNMMTNKLTLKKNEDIATIFNDQTKITQVIQSGIKAALLKHKQAGKPICEWKNDQVQWIAAENINISSAET